MQLDDQQLYLLYRPKIKHSVKRICCQYKLNYLEEDIEQDMYIVFMNLLKKYNPNYNGQVIPLDSYLFKNINLNIKARCQKEKRVLSRNVPSEIYPNNNQKYVDQYNTNEEIIKVINKLDPDIRNIVLLKLQGYKQIEIKKILSISQSKISNILKAIKENDTSRYDIQPLIDYKEALKKENE